MPEYIERETVVKALCAEADKLKEGEADALAGLYLANVIADKLPAADVAPVRHGKWIKNIWVKTDDPDGGFWVVRCTQCSIPHDKESRFCPNCGAKMDGEPVVERRI